MPTVRPSSPHRDALRDAELTRLLGRRVRDDGGVLLGRLSDLAISPSGPSAFVVAAEVRSGQDRTWRAPVQINREEGALTLLGSQPVDGPPRDSLLLRRDVLDAQVVDLRGRRLARVGDVILAASGDRSKSSP